VNKYIIFIVNLFLFSGCVTPSSHIPGHSLAATSNRLSRDTLQLIGWYEIIATHNKDSAKVQVIDTSLVQEPINFRNEPYTDHLVAKWSELWTIKRGTSNVVYRVQFDAQGSKVTDIRANLDIPK
jgi:hypothetical protein